MDEELDRLLGVVNVTEAEWKAHRRTGHEASYGDGVAVGTGDATEATMAEWREVDDKLKVAYEAAHQAWRTHRPKS